MSYSRSFTVTLTVAAGVGSGTFSFPATSGVRVKTVAIDAPPAATYDWFLKDADGYAMTGAAAASGDVTYAVNLPMGATGAISFASATAGVYKIRIWAEYN